MILFERPLYLLFNLWLKPTLRAEPLFDFFSGEEKLGTGHYLSNRGRGGRSIWGGGGVTWYLGEQKGESVVTEKPKEEVIEIFWKGLEGGPLKFAWKMKELWGIAKVIECF